MAYVWKTSFGYTGRRRIRNGTKAKDAELWRLAQAARVGNLSLQLASFCMVGAMEMDNAFGLLWPMSICRETTLRRRASSTGGWSYANVGSSNRCCCTSQLEVLACVNERIYILMIIGYRKPALYKIKLIN